ncbi:hypothetical protein C815_01854 [Firmicutes bacterium M10-2]|nr:hypothetical protein C815_01854 [Firmicutes bacterium M10-2]
MKAKIALILALTLGLSACSAAPAKNQTDQPISQQANEQFTKYLNDYVVEMAESDFTTMHQFFEHPENYGIDPEKVEVTLGSIEPDEESKALEKKLSDQLDSFDRSSLDERQQTIYDQLQYQFDQSQQEEEEKFRYLGNMWSSMNGLPQTLVSYFSEYELRQESDIAPLIQLINDIPRYTKEALTYSEKQAENDTLMLDYEDTIQSCQEILNSKENSAVTAELMKDVEQLDLDPEKTIQYEKQIKDALDTSFFPSYQLMIDGLTKLKDSIQPVAGMASLENGKEYYELLVQQYTGTTDSIETIKKNVENEIDEISTQVSSLLTDDNYDMILNYMNLKTDFENVEDILVFLNENYDRYFPQVDAMKYDLQPLADDQSQEGIVAYFMIPAVDSTTDYRIRYNRRDYGDDPSALSLYQTLAHEGIPGHMYQAQYNKEHFQYTIEYFLSNSGFSEGYATYVENQSLKFLDLDPDLINMYVYEDLLNNNYILLMDIAVNYEGLNLEEFQSTFDMFDPTALESIYDQLAGNPGVFMSYYYGYNKISNLREEAKEALKDSFDDVEFNNALLQSGSVNFDLIQQNIDKYIKDNQ